MQYHKYYYNHHKLIYNKKQDYIPFQASLQPLSKRLNDPYTKENSLKFYKKQNIDKSTNDFIYIFMKILYSLQTIVSVITLTKYLKGRSIAIKKIHYNAAQKYFNFHLFLLKLSVYSMFLVGIFVYGVVLD